LSILVLVVTWAFGLTALERRRMRSTQVEGTSSPVAPLADAVSLVNDVKALTGPGMDGRLTGSPGNHRAQAYILQRFKQIGLEPVHGSYEQKFSFVHHSIKGLVLPGRPFTTTYPDATNLVGALRGSSDPDSWLIISAHFDHLGVRGHELYPGADDNASGIAAMIAAATYLAAHPPRHSVLFAAFDAEEEGLRGSRHFVAHPPMDLARVQLLVNLDMVSRGDEGFIVASGTRGDDRLRALVTGAAATRAIRVQFGHDRPMYLAGRVEDWTQSSDQGPFHDAGVRTIYFGVEDHADYHRPGDTVERVPVLFFAEAASLVIGTVIAADR
jgi:Zn-dependent M28 family amino/carboxypeptidase